MKPIKIDIDNFPSIADTLMNRHESQARKDLLIANDEFSLISSDPPEAKRLLINCPELITSEKNYIVYGDVQKFLIGTIKDIMETQGYTATFEGEHFLLEAKKDANLPAVPPLPVGYRPCKLSMQHADLIQSFWFQAPGTDQYIKHVLEHHPNVGVETESGDLVGWMLGHTFGAHGVLHILEAHRRKGLGKYLTMSLRDLVLAMGKPSYMHVSCENTVSLKLAESCGFKVVNDGEDHEHIFIGFLKK